ncbi:MAG: DNA polymerase III subunit alpha, partial [Thermomicrobiales bacterium]
LGYRALAITDHDNVHGAMEFTKAAQAVGIQPITGAEVTLLDGSHLTLLAETPAGYANLCRLLTAAHGAPLDATPLWPPAYADPAGYPDASPDDDGVDAPDDGVDAPGPIPATRTPGAPRRSRRPNTPAAERVPRLDPALLGSHAEGLILLTGCRRGALSGLVDDDRLPEAEALLRRYLDWFGTGQVVVELQHNHVHGDARRVARLVGLAGRLGLPHAATGNVHYHHRDRHRLQDVVTAIRHRTTLDGCHRERRPNAEFALRPIPEVVELFRPYPAAVRTTLDLAERCAGFDLSRDLAYRFPDYPTDPGETPDDLLARVCRAALDRRYPPGPAPVQDATPVPSPAPGRDPTSSSGFTLVIEPAPRRGDTTTPHRSGTRRSVPTSPPVVPPPPSRVTAVDRLEEELGLIARHGLAGFFLLYRDLLELARSVATGIRGTGTPRDAGNLPPGRGRGSSVSSIVCYLIGLSPVDPLAHGLFLGRFLNEEIASVPDIDIDFPRDIRDRLIERVYEVFGADRVAMVCAFSTYRLRSAVRDIGKALGLPPADLDRIAKLSEPRSARDLAAELDRIPAYAARKDTPPWCYLIELAGQLAGFPRHVTQHSGGMIVSSTPLNRIVPIQPAAMPGRYICQWDKDSCDDARLVKIDFLALGMLSLVEECLDLIPAAGKPPVDLSRIDFTDAAVYDMICAGDTIGTFQIESRAQIQTLLRTHPRTIEDLTVQVAIVRPGPIIGGAVNPYVNLRQRARRGLDARPTYDHPSLEPILRETLGVILYQEQVLQVAMALSGFTAGQADQLRRAMSRKRSREAMIRLWEQFRDGAYGRGVDPETTRTVFKKLIGFATYGFPKCHSVAFAVLAYQSSWLKHYYPAEFMAALLNNQPMGFYPPHVLTNDAKRHGIRILPPDVNASAARCVVEGNAVRIGLGYVDGLGEEAAGRIERERMEHGPFLSLADLVRRVPLRTAAAEALVAVGSCDGFGLGRREALWQL